MGRKFASVRNVRDSQGKLFIVFRAGFEKAEFESAETGLGGVFRSQVAHRTFAVGFYSAWRDLKTFSGFPARFAALDAKKNVGFAGGKGDRWLLGFHGFLPEHCAGRMLLFCY